MKVTFELREDLADRLPEDESELRAFLERAVKHELDGVVPEWLSRGGKTITPAKSAAARENGKKGGRPKGSGNKPADTGDVAQEVEW